MFNDRGAVALTRANFDSQMTTALGPAPTRDQILGVTNNGSTGFAGAAMLTKKIASGGNVTFAASDLSGPWRVYLQRVEEKLAGGTWQTGQVMLGATGQLVSSVATPSTLQDHTGAVTSLTTGGLSVTTTGASPGTVTGTLTSAAGDQYTIASATMRAAKDVITGVVNAVIAGQTHRGLVTMVREITVIDLAQTTYNVAEGQPLTITVGRTGNPVGTVTVPYDVGGGTAPAGDYTVSYGTTVGNTGTLTFGPNVGSQVLKIATKGDTNAQGDRSVLLTLGAPPQANAVLGLRPGATVTIKDDDGPGIVRFTAGSFTAPESGGKVKLPVQRVGGNTAIVVSFATLDGTAHAGTDFTGIASGSVTFVPNQMTQTLEIEIKPNQIVDGDRTFTVQLTGSPSGVVIGAPSVATVTIKDDDVGGVVKFASPAVSVLEGGLATLKLARTAAGGNVTVEYVTADVTANAPADYTAAAKAVTFGPGEMTKDITVQTAADSVAEGDETFRVLLRNPVGMTLGTPSAATVTIQDAQQGVQFSAPSYQVTEGTANAVITVVRTGPAGGPVTVRYATAPGTATPGADYTPVSGTLTFTGTVRQMTFMVPIANDTLPEGAETVLLVLADPGGGAQLGPQAAATLTILDNDVPGQFKLSAAAYTVAENVPTATITVQRMGTAGPLTVDYRTQDGTATAGQDYLGTRGTLTFGPTDTVKSFTVRVLSDGWDEPNETFTVLLENPTGGATLGTPSSALVTITDVDVPGAIAFGQPLYTVAESAGQATVLVTRTGGQAGGVTVDLEVTGGAAVEGQDWSGPLPLHLTFAPGEASKPLTIAIVDDTPIEGKETIFLRLFNPGGGGVLGPISTTAIVITDNDPGPVVTFDAERASVSETAKTLTVNVVRTLPGAGQSVSLVLDSSQCGARVTVDRAQIAFAPTQLSAPVKFTIADDSRNQGPCQAHLTLVNPSPGLNLGTAYQFALTVLDNDAQIDFTSPTFAVTEGGTAGLIVQRIGALSGVMTVRWTATNGTAVGPADFTPTSGTLTFAAGEASQQIRITTTNDVIPEGVETFLVTLSAPTGGGFLGPQASATVSINPDADLAGAFQLTGDATVVEGGVATLTVTRAGGAGGPVAINYLTQDGTATVAGKDYVAKVGSLTFAAGVLSQPLMVTTLADTVVEGPQTFQVLLALPAGSLATLGSRNTSTVTILDAQTPRVQLGAPAYSVVESAGTLNVPVTRLGPTTQESTVSWTVAPGTALGGGVDYTATSGTLTFPAGSTAPQTIPIAIINDLISEPTKTFTVVLTGASAGTQIGIPAAATVTLTDDDVAGQVQFGAAASAVIEGQTALLTLLRTNGVAAGVQVSVVVDGASTASAGTDYGTFTQTYAFGAGESQKVVSIPTVADGLREGAKFLRLRVQVTGGGATVGTVGETTLWIVDDVQTFRFEQASATVTEGETVTVTVLRAGPPVGTVTVNYLASVPTTATLGVDYVGGSGTLTFAPGVVRQSFTIQTLNDSEVEPSETVVVFLGAGAGAAIDPTGGQFTLTILDNELPNLTVAEVIAPVQAGTGLPMSLAVTVRNLSGVVAPKSKLAIFLAPLPAPFGQQIALIDAPAMAGGASVTLPLIVTVPPDTTPGNYFVAAQIDALNAVTESSEADNGGASATLTQVISLRPDLIVTAVPSPGNTLSGKLLSTPLHVQNAGQAAAGPFRVGVFLSQNQSAGSGLQLASRTIPGLAPGAGVDIPVSLQVPDGMAQGAYYVSAIADIDAAVVESDKTNNSLASSVAFQVTPNLGKLVRVSASFVTDAVACSPPFAGQTIALTGTLNVTSQPGTSGSGTISLSGLASAGLVSFKGTFSGSVHPDESVDISIDVTASGAFSGHATASGTGALVDGVLQVNQLAGTLTVAPFGSCPFVGSLQVTADQSYFFSLLHFAQGGSFNGLTTPQPVYPLPILAFSAALLELFDPNPPAASQVRFTGPPGSGVVNQPADGFQGTGPARFYETDTFAVPATTLAGTWTVKYGSATKTFAVANPEAEQRFVAMLPTVTLNAAQTHILSVSWVYKDRRTGLTVPAPLHADAIQVEIDPNGYKSPDMPRTVFSHTFPAPGIPLAEAGVVYISYKDTLTGNFYVTVYFQ